MPEDDLSTHSSQEDGDNESDFSDDYVSISDGSVVSLSLSQRFHACFAPRYARLKENTMWFMEKWTMSLSADDFLMVMTLFVLFGDNIKLLAAPRELDSGFEVANSICMFFFIAELIANTWVRTNISSWCPFKFTGYLGTFFFYLDVVSIVSMWFDITWIAVPMGMGDIANQVGSQNSNLTKAGRVARLVRLVRLVRLYKLAMEKRQKMKEENEIRKLIERGDVTYEDVQKQRMLNQKRESKLGEKLSSIITQKVIILVLTMVIIIPLLQPSNDNTSPLFAVTFLQAANVAYAAGTLDLDIVNKFILQAQSEMTYDGHSSAASEPDIIYLRMSSLSTPVQINNAPRRA